MSSVEAVATQVKRTSFYNYLLPFFMLITLGSVRHCGILFNSNSRWLLLSVLLLYLLARKHVLRFFTLDKSFIMVFFLYLGWCFLTVFWSLVPMLSFLKTGLLAFIPVTLICAGIQWMRTHTWDEALDYLWLLSAVTLLGGFLGKIDFESSVNLNGLMFAYQGMVSGSNMFGFLLGMVCFPYLLWKSYRMWSQPKKRLLWLSLLICTVIFLVMSMARTAMLAALIIFSIFLLSLHMNKKIAIFIGFIVVSLGVFIFNPNLFLGAVDSGKLYVFKGHEDNLFSSRSWNWIASYEAAEEGGWFGVGYGASAGERNFAMKQGYSAKGYGREKGNSQLAIVEETGMVGLLFYFILLGCLLKKSVRLFLMQRVRHDKVLCSLFLGMFLAIFVTSLFEAWWDSPGGPENMYFWLLIGILRGMEIKRSVCRT
jgi:O-antigen ligase